jgi:tetratricopeptide (TPR) repeat protein
LLGLRRDGKIQVVLETHCDLFIRGAAMKSDSSQPASSSEAGAEILSKLTAVEDLLLRPSASALDDTLGPAPSKPAPKISLVRYQELEQQIRNAPADAEPYRELAEIYSQQGRWKDVRRVLEMGVRHNPEDEPLLVLLEDSQLQSARQTLSAAREGCRVHPSAENADHLQRCEIDLANLRLAIGQARLARHPEQLELLIPCAIALRQLGRMDEAVSGLRTAQREPSLRARASLQLGMCLQQMGQVVESLAAYRQAALYRAPEPPAELKARALELAAELAEQSGLIYSARLYISELLMVHEVQPDKWRAKLSALEANSESHLESNSTT